MEGIYWLRISAVAALILGSLYVLLPTILGGDAEVRLATTASGVETTGPRTSLLEVDLDVVSGDPQATADALAARLRAANVASEGVDVEDGDVTVRLAIGARREDVVRLAQQRGASALYAPAAIRELPPAVPADVPPAGGPLADALAGRTDLDAAYWASVLPALADAPVPPDAVALQVAVGRAAATAAGARLEWLGEQVFPADVALALVAIDDRVRGVAFPDGRFFPLGDPSDTVALLVAGPLPGQLAPAAEPAAATAAAAAEPAPAEKPLPDWLASVLPATKIPFGLDLQGGIDLTLQVELEEAVLSQASRDATFLKDHAADEQIVLDAVRRAYTEPVLEITTATDLGTLQTFMRKYAGDYVYASSSGTEHHFEMSDQRVAQVQEQAVEQVLETIRKRVGATGVREESIVKKGGGRINVQLPGYTDVQGAVDAIGTTAVLEFRKVDEDFDPAYLEEILADARRQMPPEQFADDELLNIWLWEHKKLDEDRVLLWMYRAETGEEVEKRVEVSDVSPLVLFDKVELTGNDVNDAGVGWDQAQRPYVMLEFKPRGGRVFCTLTSEAVGDRFGVILDDRIQSAPQINEKICGGAARIEMGSVEDPLDQAQALSLVLRTGALDAPVVVASVRHVGSTLGEDAKRAGTTAAVVGSLLIVVFMVVWYQTSGVIADIALGVNVLMILAALAMFGATLTLPGIAGIALTAGMAVDSNIIVYERIREELRLGVHPRKAVDAGFDKALVAILDANITTAIAGIVLFSYGSGPLKGFAVTLLIGIVTTLVTAVFVTRTIMELVTRSSAARLRI